MLSTTRGTLSGERVERSREERPGMLSLPARQAGEVDVQERRMMRLRIMEGVGAGWAGGRERSLWRRACVLREDH